MIYVDLDHELDNAITLATPEFTSSLKRRFTNVGVSQSILNRKINSSPIKFDDFYIRDGENRVELKNIEIKEPPVARMNEIVSNLKERNLKISADWHNIVLSGSYEMHNTSQIKLLPVVSTGDIVITIENIVAHGLVGFNIEGEALRATNFDLTHNVRNVSVQVEYYHDSKKLREHNVIQHEDIDCTIAKYIKNDLFWNLEESLRNNLDQVLMDYNLLEIFSDNSEITQKYRTMTRSTDATTNMLVDLLMVRIKKKIGSKGFIDLPNIRESSFLAVSGKVGDLRTLERINSFTFVSDQKTHLITLFGEMGIKDCQAFYTKWSYATFLNTFSGSFLVNVGKNSMKLKLIINSNNLLHKKLQFEQIDFKVVRLDSLDVRITGVGIFNWCANKIITWVSSLFKSEIMELITKHVNSSLQAYVKSKTMLNGNK